MKRLAIGDEGRCRRVDRRPPSPSFRVASLECQGPGGLPARDGFGRAGQAHNQAVAAHVLRSGRRLAARGNREAEDVAAAGAASASKGPTVHDEEVLVRAGVDRCGPAAGQRSDCAS